MFKFAEILTEETDVIEISEILDKISQMGSNCILIHYINKIWKICNIATELEWNVTATIFLVKNDDVLEGLPQKMTVLQSCKSISIAHK